MNNSRRANSCSFHIPLGMIFKRAYCCRCVQKLKRKFLPVGYQEEGSTFFGFSGTSLHFSYRSPRIVEENECFYSCEHCHYYISYDDQKIIAEYQKESGKRILTDKQIDFLNNMFENKFN